jgi:hypothetical protein
VIKVRINIIYEARKYNEHRELRDRCEYKKTKHRDKEQISFAEILKKEKQNTYLKINQ